MTPAEFLLMCSGADRDVLRASALGWDRRRFMAIGGSVLVTSAMSALSIGYAVNLVFHSPALAAASGATWGAFALLLERLLVSERPHPPSAVPVSVAERVRAKRQRIITAVPRLALAAILGAVTAIPLQMRLFDTIISAELASERQRFRSDITAMTRQRYPDLSILAAENDRLALQLRQADERIVQCERNLLQEPSGTLSGPIFDQRRRDLLNARASSDSLRRVLQPRIAANTKRIDTLRSAANAYERTLIHMTSSNADLLTRLRVLRVLGERNPDIRLAGTFVVLLFVLVQLMPVSTSLLTSSSRYEYFWETFDALAASTPKIANADVIDHRSNIRLANDQVDGAATESSTHRQLIAFICHASEDKPTVQTLADRLRRDGVNVWIDHERLLPGQDWDLEIRRAIRAADAVIACLSCWSVRKTGYVQRELRFAIDVAAEQPEGSIFLIPTKLDDCDVPSRLEGSHYTKLYAADGYSRLLDALGERARQKRLALRAAPAS